MNHRDEIIFWRNVVLAADHMCMDVVTRRDPSLCPLCADMGYLKGFAMNRLAQIITDDDEPVGDVS